jgi:hypothetical protein
MPNPVVHFEVVGKDGPKIQGFYSSLFGWTVDANNPMNYGMVAAGEGGIGGGISGGDAPSVCFYVQVDDLQKSLDQAVGLGGKVIMPVTEIPGMVTLAQFADPEGNVIGLVKGT